MCVLLTPALGVSVKSVHLVVGRLGFYSQSGHTKDFKNSIRSFRARRSAQAEKFVGKLLLAACWHNLLLEFSSSNLLTIWSY